MSDQQYLTVRQFAAAVGKSPQSIYKAVDNRLSTYCKRENGAIMIFADALALYGCQPVVNQLPTEETPQESQKSENQPAAGCQPVDNPEIELLRETITTLQEQLTVKDKQIEQLTAALTTALNTANAAQALHAGEIQARITAGTDTKEPTDGEQGADQPQPEPEKPAKETFWERIFKRKEG